MSKQITIGARITKELEAMLEQYATQHKWSKSFALCEILRQYFYELTANESC